VPTGNVDQVLVVSILNWLLRGRNPVARVDQETGRYLLDFGTRYKWVAACYLVATSAFVALGIAIAPQLAASGVILVSLIFGSMWLAGVWVVLDAFLVGLSFSSDGVTRILPLRGTAYLPWSRVTKVDYVASANWFSFRSVDNMVIRVSIYRNGLATLEQVSGLALKTSPCGKAPYLLYEKAQNPK
jgi:hypothetical protein